MQRRGILKGGLLGVAGLAMARPELPAIPPFERNGRARFKVGLAAYSFRSQFGWMKGEPKAVAGRSIDMPGFIDFCAEHGCDGAELTSYFFRGGAAAPYYRDLKRHAFLRGIAISGTAVGNDFALPEGEQRDRQIADVKAWIDKAALLGAPHVRVFAGAAKGLDPDVARKLCVSALQECCEHAGRHGIFLGLENHGGIVAEAEGMLAIIRAVDSPWFGVNLDTGNFKTDDPYGDLAKVAPYAVNVQLKVEVRPKGKPSERADLDRLADILRGTGYQGYVTLEYEEDGDPWNEIPVWLERVRAMGA